MMCRVCVFLFPISELLPSEQWFFRGSRDAVPTTEERSIDCKHHMTLAMDVDWSRQKLCTASWDYNVDMWDLQTGWGPKAEAKKLGRCLNCLEIEFGRIN